MEAFKKDGKYTLSVFEKEALAALNMRAARCSNKETQTTLAGIFKESGIIIDPHTATAVFASRCLGISQMNPTVIISTAHPAKFPDIVEQKTGIKPSLPFHMRDLMNRKEEMTVLDKDVKIIKAFIDKNQKE